MREEGRKGGRSEGWKGEGEGGREGIPRSTYSVLDWKSLYHSLESDDEPLVGVPPMSGDVTQKHLCVHGYDREKERERE